LFAGQRIARFANIERVALRKLQMLYVAKKKEELSVPPANRLEDLKGSRIGQSSIRINAQWRLCFEFVDGNAYDVEITDYH
jgi:proteic killer suppression protein